MEKILVAMDPQNTNFYACIHALNLARRIKAKVLFLLVFSRSAMETEKSQEELANPVKRRLDSFIEEGRSDGVVVDYYLVYGDFENEIVSFIQENRITLLVVELPSEQRQLAEDFKSFLERIRHRINCRIEVVNEKPVITERKEDSSVASLPTNSRK
jgi:K+-sensing histidine kinase KdpD